MTDFNKAAGAISLHFAYPSRLAVGPHEIDVAGLSKRQWVAAHVASGLVASGKQLGYSGLADTAVRIADEILRACDDLPDPAIERYEAQEQEDADDPA